MAYLIFNQEEELLDVLNFTSPEELETYKGANPTHIIREEDDQIFFEDDLFPEDEDELEW